MPHPTIEITIQDKPFQVPQPFAEGHQCTAGEAGALNQLFAENLRNNFAKRVKATGGLDMPGLQAELDGYAAQYTLKGRPPGLSATTPIAREAIKIARAQIDSKLAEKGIKKDQLKDGRYDELVAEVSARGPVIAEAARRIAAIQATAAEAIEV